MGPPIEWLVPMCENKAGLAGSALALLFDGSMVSCSTSYGAPPSFSQLSIAFHRGDLISFGMIAS